MSPRTLRLLEFDKIQRLLAAQAGSPLGQERALALRPQRDLERIRLWQQETTEARRLLEAYGSIPLEGLHDLRPLLQRVRVGGRLEAQELLDCAETARCARQVRRFLRRAEVPCPALRELAEGMAEFPRFEEEVARCLNPDGTVRDEASPRLAHLRRSIRSLQQEIQRQLQRYLHDPTLAEHLQERLIALRNGRFCLPVKAERQRFVRGILHDTSASGATVFIEPEAVVRLNNELRELESQEKEEIERILSVLTALIHEEVDSWAETLRRLGILDLAAAKGKLSLLLDAVEPQLNTEGILELKGARHPLLLVRGRPELHPWEGVEEEDEEVPSFPRASPPSEVVPLNLWLGKEFWTLVITGPNTGGKTVALKTVGLLTLMAQAGLHIPADEGSQIAVFPRIFADIGDEQSIERDLSTFSSHMRELVRILHQARPPSLVLLDEIGVGTDPVEGAALAQAVLAELHRRRLHTIATTHYGELKAFAYTTPGAANASMEFDEESLRPTYRLHIGTPGSSYALVIAERLGMPPSVVQSAQALLGPDRRRAEHVLAEMERTRRQLEQEREEARQEREHWAALRRQLEAEQARLAEVEARLRRRWEEEVRQRWQQWEEEARAILRRLREQSREGKATEQLRQALKAVRQRSEAEALPPPLLPPPPSAPAEEAPPPALQPGDEVFLKRHKQRARVLSPPDERGEVKVQAGLLQLTVPSSEVEPLPSGPTVIYRPSPKGLTLPRELHLRGLTVEEALEEVDRYLDEAFLAHYREVRIVHGKGTGALRRAVQEHLSRHPHVSDFHDAPPAEGGSGVTIVRLFSPSQP